MFTPLIALVLLAAPPAAPSPAGRPHDPERSPLGRTYEKVPDRARLAGTFKFAVLDPVMDKADDEKKPLVDRVVFELRRAANNQVTGLGVMTKEIMVQLLQASPEGCSDGECAARTGERVGADYIVDGKLRRSGGQLEVELRLWKVDGGRQLSTILAAGKTPEELLLDLKANLVDLLKPVQLALDQEIASAKEQVETRRAQLAFDAAQSSDEKRAQQLAQEQAREEARQKRLDEERVKKDAEAKAREESLKAERDAAPRRGVLRKVGWGLGAAGLLAGGVATVAGLAGAKITTKIKTGDYNSVAELKDASGQVASINAVTTVAAISAAALLGTGLVLVLFNQDGDRDASTQLTVSPAGLLVAGRF